jgi:hypothetical protein
MGGPIVLDSALDALRHGLDDPTADAERLHLRPLILGTIALMILPDGALPPARIAALHQLDLVLDDAADRAGVVGPARTAVCAPIRGAAYRELLFDLAEDSAPEPNSRTAAPSGEDRLVG